MIFSWRYGSRRPPTGQCSEQNDLAVDRYYSSRTFGRWLYDGVPDERHVVRRTRADRGWFENRRRGSFPSNFADEMTAVRRLLLSANVRNVRFPSSRRSVVSSGFADVDLPISFFARVLKRKRNNNRRNFRTPSRFSRREWIFKNWIRLGALLNARRVFVTPHPIPFRLNRYRNTSPRKKRKKR